MTNNSVSHPRGTGGMIFGGVLILLGIVVLGLQLLNLDISISSNMWPFLIILPGLFLFGLAFVSNVKDGEHFAIIGSIVTVLGLLLLYQSNTGQWSNWAYTWALLLPTSCGVGQIIFGSVKHRPEIVKTGTRLALIGTAIFLVGFFFFEFVIGLGGFYHGGLRIVRYGWPIVLMGIGLILILNNLLGGSDRTPPQQDSTLQDSKQQNPT